MLDGRLGIGIVRGGSGNPLDRQSQRDLGGRNGVAEQEALSQ
jgi:hypothetical protein